MVRPLDAGRLLRLLAASIVLLAGTPRASWAEPTEYQLKAVFLYSLTKYVRWPEESAGRPDEPLRICVLGADPFGRFLDETVAGETVRGRAVATRRLSSVAEVDACHVVFLADTPGMPAPETLDAVATKSILTVGDSEGFAEQGGIVGMVERTNRIGLVVNLGAAERAGLVISSQLLRLSEIVGRDEAQR